MTNRKLLLAGCAALAGVLAFSPDANAFGKKKRRGGGCDDCAPAPMPAYCGYGGHDDHGCYGGHVGHVGHVGHGGCGGCGTAMGPSGHVGGHVGGYAVATPEAMPALGIAPTTLGAVVPAAGTSGGGVVPAAGTAYVPQAGVMPAGGYHPGGSHVMPAGGYVQNGNYVTPAGYGSFQSGFGSGVVQGALGTPNYGYGYGTTPAGVVGNQAGRGLFRRR